MGSVLFYSRPDVQHGGHGRPLGPVAALMPLGNGSCKSRAGRGSDLPTGAKSCNLAGLLTDKRRWGVRLQLCLLLRMPQ